MQVLDDRQQQPMNLSRKSRRTSCYCCGLDDFVESAVTKKGYKQRQKQNALAFYNVF